MLNQSAPYTATKGGTSTGGGEQGGNELVVGDNNVNVVDGYNGDEYVFTATEAGTYIVSFGSEAFVMQLTDLGTENIDSGKEVTLDAGDSVTFLCATASEQSGSYTLTIEKK